MRTINFHQEIHELADLRRVQHNLGHQVGLMRAFGVWVCAVVCVCVCVCACSCVRACVCACVHMCGQKSHFIVNQYIHTHYKHCI